MIEKIDISGSGDYKPDEAFKKYAVKRIGKLDRYLPRASKKDAIVKINVEQISKDKTERFEVSVNLEVPGGRTFSATDECQNIHAGIDLIEAKLTGQIRRYKTEITDAAKKKTLKSLGVK